jgi:hypothetical protein
VRAECEEFLSGEIVTLLAVFAVGFGLIAFERKPA